MKVYSIYENFKGEEKLIKSGLTITEAEQLKKELTIKYADCNTSYEIR